MGAGALKQYRRLLCPPARLYKEHVHTWMAMRPRSVSSKQSNPCIYDEPSQKQSAEQSQTWRKTSVPRQERYNPRIGGKIVEELEKEKKRRYGGTRRR